MIYSVNFNNRMNAFAGGRKSRRKARWKKKMMRYLSRNYMFVFFS